MEKKTKRKNKKQSGQNPNSVFQEQKDTLALLK
jgi:hypothetical protein